MNTNKLLQKIPFLRFFIPFAIGVIIYLQLQPNKSLFSELLFFYFVLVACYFLIFKTKSNVLKSVFGIVVQVLFFFFGLQCVYLQQPLNRKNHYSNLSINQSTEFKGYVKDIPKKSGLRNLKTTVSINQMLVNNKWQDCEGNVLVYLPISDSLLELGNFIQFKNRLSEIPEPKNPFEFNYRAYLKGKGIFHQLYLKSDEFKQIKSNEQSTFLRYADQLKNHLIKVLKSHGLSGDKLAITSALLLGYDDEISKELLNAYSATGTLHVLSVSGLHVGLVFLILNFLIRLPNNRFYNLVKGILMLACIWFYAALTGLSPSVVRSASMFSFIIIGTIINRKGNIYNTLLASAFVILLFEPNLILDIGFQLSYVAVAGIVFFYPYIDNWWKPNNKWLKKLWQTTAISISAQLVTLPISLFYFGQFPVLFFISNLVVIPLSYVVMFGAMILVAISPIKWLASVITYLLSISVEWMNQITLFLDGFSYLNISDAKISLLETVMFFILIVFSTHFFIKKNFQTGMLSLLTCIILMLFSIKGVFTTTNKLIVYHLKGETGIDVFKDGISYSYTYSDSSIIKLNKVAKPNRIANNIRKTELLKLKSGFHYMEINKKNIGILINDTLLKYDLDLMDLDFLILTKNPYLKGINSETAKHIIIDGSIDFRTRKYIEKQHLGNVTNTFEGAYLKEL